MNKTIRATEKQSPVSCIAEYREPLPYSNGVDGATPISKSFSDTEIASNDVLAGMQPGPMIGQPMTRYMELQVVA